MEEREFYNAESLDRVVEWYEARYGVTSDTLLELHRSGDRLEGLPDSDRHIWLSMYRESRDLRHSGFADRVVATQSTPLHYSHAHEPPILHVAAHVLPRGSTRPYRGA